MKQFCVSLNLKSLIKKPEEAAKIQLKYAILRKVKQQLPNEAKDKGHLDQLLRSLHNQISSFKSEIGFLREEVKEKNNVIGTLLRRNSSSSPCESSKIDNISEINEERRDTCILTTSNPIKSDNNCQFTKLAKQKSRVKDVQADSVIVSPPPPYKERDKAPPPSQNPTNYPKSKTLVFIVGDSMI